MSEDTSTTPAEKVEENNQTNLVKQQYTKSHRKPAPVIPEGMTKKEWKRQQKRIRWEETRDEFREQKRLKRIQTREARKIKIQQAKENGEDPSELFPSKRHPKVKEQLQSGAHVILDCDFDEYMLEKEIVSMTNQITRCYSENKRNKYKIDLTVTSFDKRIKERYDKILSHYKNWLEEDIKFVQSDLQSNLPEDLSKVVYLSADTDERLEELKPGETYIVGGIVDKGRHKFLCKNKADELGIQTKRLPIDEFIKLSGRRVLATSHVVELLIKWFEFRDWKQTFESVIPTRKFASEESLTPGTETPAETETPTEETKI